MVRRVIEWLLDSPNPEIDREYADPAAPDTPRLADDDLDCIGETGLVGGAAPIDLI
jgi:hypothetical protein